MPLSITLILELGNGTYRGKGKNIYRVTGALRFGARKERKKERQAHKEKAGCECGWSNKGNISEGKEF